MDFATDSIGVVCTAGGDPNQLSDVGNAAIDAPASSATTLRI
jgi:hypothetical protein